MSFTALPPVASWRHVGARSGFEVAFFTGTRVEGTTTATEDGESWIVSYVIHLDESWRTRSARITSRSHGTTTATEIETDGDGHWQVDGVPAPQLDGCLDLDLEASAMTNTFPVHRLRMPTGRPVPAPAAYVRAIGLETGRLDQTYTHTGDGHYDYTAPAFDFAARLGYDRHGLVVDYPGIAVRVQ